MDNKMTNESTIKAINELHDNFNSLAKQTLNIALEIGSRLEHEKNNLPHGQFTNWINENLNFTPRTARNYLNLHNNRAKLQGVTNLNDAYKILKPKTETVSDLPDDISECEKISDYLHSVVYLSESSYYNSYNRQGKTLDGHNLIPEKGYELTLLSEKPVDPKMKNGTDALKIKHSEKHNGFIDINIDRISHDADFSYQIYNKTGGIKIESSIELIKFYKDKFNFFSVIGACLDKKKHL